MNSRSFVPWFALLMIYNLAIAAVVLFFMAHCGTAGRSMLGEHVPPAQHASASVLSA